MNKIEQIRQIPVQDAIRQTEAERAVATHPCDIARLDRVIEWLKEKAAKRLNMDEERPCPCECHRKKAAK